MAIQSEDSEKRSESFGVDREVAAAPLINSKNHEPDREFDALIAERVMGWTRVRVMPAGQLRGVDPLTEHLQTEYDRRHHLPPRPVRVPEFSTDLGAAIQIVARITTLFGWASLSLTDTGRFDDDERWTAAFSGHDAAFAPTAARVICLAALRAVDA